jgi:hypothetical protein
MANIFTKRGDEVKESINRQKIDLKKAYIRLKDGESVRVRILSPKDYVEYLSHGDFALGIYTQPCTLPLGRPCAFDEVVKIVKDLPKDHELKKFERLYAKPRYVFAFADIDAGEIRFWDASKSQAKVIIQQIEEYKEDLSEIAFTFKRTGNKNETTYSLNPILRLKGDDVEKFHKFEGMEVTDDLFNQVLVPRTYEQQLQALKQAGFPVEEYFDVDLGEEATPIEDSGDEDENPTATF